MSNQPEAPFIRSVGLRREPSDYSAAIPAVRALLRGSLELHPHVTLFVGENGSGKSTLVEAIAVAAKLNPEGGGNRLRFTTRASHSDLYRHLELEWAPIRPVNAFFLRAESVFNLATAAEVDRFERVVYDRPLHEQSHGESFLDIALNRFAPRGLYILDEPEAALSVNGQLVLLRRIHELAREHSQLLVSTHSPILVGYPDAAIYRLSDAGIERVQYEETEQVQLTSAFLADRGRFLRYLLSDD